MKILSMLAVLFQVKDKPTDGGTDGLTEDKWTDRNDEANSCFSQLYKCIEIFILW